MKLNNHLLRQYSESGYLIFEQVFSDDELNSLELGIKQIEEAESTKLVYESDNRTVRSLHRPHDQKDILWRLSKDSRLVYPVRDLLRSEIYAYQIKLNFKAANSGEAWPWHRDFSYWYHEDGMKAPRVLTVGIFMDDITEFNGPLSYIPGSHLDTEKLDINSTNTVESTGEKDWRAGFNTNPLYTVSEELVSELVEKNGTNVITGRKGTMLIFDGNIIHSSVRNQSDNKRRIIFITYNCIDNFLENGKSYRPDFIINRDMSPIEPVTGKIELHEDINV